MVGRVGLTIFAEALSLGSRIFRAGVEICDRGHRAVGGADIAFDAFVQRMIDGLPENVVHRKSPMSGRLEMAMTKTNWRRQTTE
jgi:hypothetical protein